MEKTINIERDFTFEEWESLSSDLKSRVINQFWNPYDLQFGMDTRKSIVNAFADKLNVEFLKIGIEYFGWGVWMIFVIVDDSKTRIPKEFTNIPVNKGIILENLNNNIVKVKYSYGGTVEIDLKEERKIKKCDTKTINHH